MNALLNVTRGLGTAALTLKKFAPEILTFTGVVTGVGATASAVKATLKVDGILTESEDKKEKIEGVHSGLIPVNAEYTDEDYEKDLKSLKVQTAWAMVKNYAPTAILTVASASLVLTGMHVFHVRNAALASAFAAVSSSYSRYRKSVREELGEMEDFRYAHGLKADEVNLAEVIDAESGEVQKQISVVRKAPECDKYSPYARLFEQTSRYWSDYPENNRSFLIQKEQEATRMLHRRGYLFLNEVYDMLGMPGSRIGHVIGWRDNTGMKQVSFGLHKCLGSDEAKIDFLNGYEAGVMLDFNVDGNIYDNMLTDACFCGDW